MLARQVRHETYFAKKKISDIVDANSVKAFLNDSHYNKSMKISKY